MGELLGGESLDGEKSFAMPASNSIINTEKEIEDFINKLNNLLPCVEYDKNDSLLCFRIKRDVNDIMFLCKSIKKFPNAYKLKNEKVLCMHGC